MDHGYQSWTGIRGPKCARESVPLDVIKTRSWGLLHHAMFHSYPHHDAEGYATFVQVTSGIKLWVIMRPKPGREHKTRQDLYKSQIGFSAEYLDYDEDWDRWLLTAMPGDIV